MKKHCLPFALFSQKLKKNLLRSGCSLFLLSALHSRAQKPWQQLNFPDKASARQIFSQPPPEWANTVTWGWNGPIDQASIRRDLDSLHALGFRAATIEAGYRMPAPYLSEGWFELVKIAVEEARQRDMRLWIIDEGKYPSGFAGGKFSTERPDLRMQALVVADRIPVSGGQKVSLQPDPSVLSAAAINNKGEILVIPIRSGRLEWTAPEGDWRLVLVQHRFKTSVTRSANNPTMGKDTTHALCDYLNPAAVKQFIDFTHEQYKKHIGSEFGKTVLGFRGDEPDFAYTPWTPQMLQEFKSRKGYDIQPYLASFFLPQLSDETKRAKADYWEVWSDLFGQNFFQQQADWCAQNGLEYMVHLNHDDEMAALVKSEGDFYKDFRSVQIPGIDVIWNQIWPGKAADFPKFASSAAHIFGRPRALSESFAAFTIPPHVEQARWVVNEQMVRGINLFEFMFFSSTASGKGGASGYMAEKSFPGLTAYANRACWLLAQGRPDAKVAVYFPTTSLWMGNAASEKSTFAIARQLLENHLDFDFIDDYALTRLCGLQKNRLTGKSGQTYEAVVVPSVNVLSAAALQRLKDFASGGGKLLFAGEQPSLLVDRTFLNAVPLKNKLPGSSDTSGNLSGEFLQSLPRDVQLNENVPALKYLHRKWKDADLYFFFNEGDRPVQTEVSVAWAGQLEEWDADKGTIHPVKALVKGDRISWPLQLLAGEAKFFVAGK